MVYQGKIQNGVVVLEPGVQIPEGTSVRVEPIEEAVSTCRSALFRAAERAKPTGIPDLAINHDHYLYGHPKVNGG